MADPSHHAFTEGNLLRLESGCSRIELDRKRIDQFLSKLKGLDNLSIDFFLAVWYNLAYLIDTF